MTSIELSIQELVEMLRITPVNQEYIYIHAFGGRVPNPGKPCDGENKVKDLRFAKNLVILTHILGHLSSKCSSLG